MAHENKNEEEIELTDVVSRGQESPIVTNKVVIRLIKAFNNDNFNEFKATLQPRLPWHRANRKPAEKREIALETIIAILRHKHDQNEPIKHSLRYISLVLIIFKLMGDEVFLATKKEDKTLMQHVEEHVNYKDKVSGEITTNDDFESIGNMISCLMPDWFDVADQDANDDKNYCLVNKFKQFETPQKLMEKLITVIDDDEMLIFRDACLRIIYQYLHELQNYHEEEELPFSLSPDFFCIEKVHSMKNHKYKEQILEAIVLFWPPKSTDESYELYKQKIADENSKEEITFFSLAFLLKEHQGFKFQDDLVKFINEAKKKFGDFFKVALKSKVRLLATIVEGQDEMLGTREFIYQKFPYIGVNSTIMTSFYAVQDFKVFNFFPFETKELQNSWKKRGRLVSPKDLNAEELKHLNELIKDYTNDKIPKSKELRRFIFGRNPDFSKTIFERILSTPDTIGLMQLVWDKFELSSREEILSMEFCCPKHNTERPHEKLRQGKLLLSYVIDSHNDQNLMTFLMPDNSHPTFYKKATFLKLKSDQFSEISETTLYEHHLKICLNDIVETRKFGYISFLCIFSLLEELTKHEGDFESEKVIGALIDLANSEDIFSKLGIKIDESTLEDKAKLLKLNNNVDCLLSTVVSYLDKDHDLIFSKYRETLTTSSALSPLYRMLYKIVEGDEKDFLETFSKELNSLEVECCKRYKNSEGIEHSISNLLYRLLWAAVIHDRRLVIDHIVKYKNFSTFVLKFPTNIRDTETCHYFAIKMLENGHEIGDEQLPSSWISSSDFKGFLDTRIRFENTELIEIDCNFLLHPQTRKYEVSSKGQLDDTLIFHEDIKSLELILERESFKSFITHPVIETYINLKTQKYEDIYWINLALFVVLFIVPFALLFVVRFLYAFESFPTILALCWIAIIFLSCREFFQFHITDRDHYFKKKSNRSEVPLIVFSIVTLLILSFEENLTVKFSFGLIVFVGTTFMALIVLITTIPSSKVSLHMKMLKKASITFFYFLLTFTLVLIAFSTSFCMLFGKIQDRVERNLQEANNTDNNGESNGMSPNITGNSRNFSASNETNINCTCNCNDDNTLDNFLNFQTTFVKVVLMLSGEYTVEPFDLTDCYQVLFFLFFVVSTFVIFNLIQGLTFDDVQKLRQDASRLILEHNVKKFIATSKTFHRFYEEDELKIFHDCIVWLIARKPFLHKIGKVYINMKTKEITTEVNQRQISVVKNKLDDEVFEKILAIVESESQRMNS